MMRYRAITYISLMLCVLLCGIFAPYCYPQTTLILDEDKDDLSILIHTKYLNKAPVLIFSCQNDPSVIASHGLKNIDNFIFVDKDQNECSTDFHILSLVKQRSKDPSVEIGYILKKRSGLFFNNTASYILKISIDQEDSTSLTQNKENNGILKIDGLIFRMNDFPPNPENERKNGTILEKMIHLEPGIHRYEYIKNPSLSIRWLILEPQTSTRATETGRRKPAITFLRVNPTKYLINVREASVPFWLVFSETYHQGWKLYKADQVDSRDVGLPKLAAEYRDLGVKEMQAPTAFTPKDIKYLLAKPLDVQHYQVNSYANGWYIDPKVMGAASNFDIVIYFYPQSIFYLGFFITLLTIFVCLSWQAYIFLKDLFKGRKNGNI